MRLLSLVLLAVFVAADSRATPSAQDGELPMSLTAADGTGLSLVGMSARAVVHDVVSFTELTLTFENPTDRTLEGQFRITLPESASLSRFAMRMGDRWQEGEVVERQAARRAYEDFLHRRQDPALLESSAGNEFSARVFPIAARERKELVLSYSETRARAADPYVLRLRGLPRLGNLDARVVDWTSGKARPTSRVAKDEVPREDLVVAIDTGARPFARSGELVVGRLTPVESTTRDASLTGLVVLFDTSASRALGLSAQLAHLRQTLAALAGTGKADVPLVVAAFDQSVEVIYDGKLGAFDERASAKLTARAALGASDVLGALRGLAKTLRGRKELERLVVIGDGVQTIGATDDKAIKGALAEVSAIRRVDVLLEGGLRDTPFAQRLTRGFLAQAGIVADGAQPAQILAAKLLKATRAQLAVAAAGASFVGPSRLDGVQAGDEVLVVARVPPHQPVELRAGQATLLVPPGDTGVPRELLARVVAQVEIASLVAAREALEPSQAERRDELATRVVALSVEQRVLSPLTALLVLESEEDYARYGIDRRALADILTVRGDTIAKLDRAKTLFVAKAKSRDDAPAPPRRDLNKGGVEEDGASETRGAPEDAKKEADAPESPRPSVAAAPPPASAPVADEAPAAKATASDLRDEGGPEQSASGGASLGAAVRQGRVSRPEPREREVQAEQRVAQDDEEVSGVPAYTGRFAEVMALLAQRRVGDAEKLAWAWRNDDHGDVLALLALGEVAEKAGNKGLAARAYGSIIDLFPNRADLRRYAGGRLERVGGAEALALAIDTYQKARDSRPDHPASHRMLAFALAEAKRFGEAVDILREALSRAYDRFEAADRILSEDAGIIAAAWLKAEPSREKEIARRLQGVAEIATKPSLRFVLTWETDANDVDFHIYDGKKNHAYYSNRTLASGGELYADVTTGYGPECFTIAGQKRTFPYTLKAHYYSRGPMGYGMGKLDVMRHDGRGGLRVERRPFVVMQDGAYVDLGTVSQ